MASFLSARNNVRDDGYGGSRGARLRLPLEVIAAVRAGGGRDFVRRLPLPRRRGDRRRQPLDDAAPTRSRSRGRGMDFLSMSKGGKFEDAKQPKVGEAAYPYTGPSGHECMPTVRSDARGPVRPQPAARARGPRAVRAPATPRRSSAPGGICELRAGRGDPRARRRDVVAAARQSLADPDWFAKVRRAAAPRCGAASSPTTARRSTRSTSRSPASCGIATASSNSLDMIGLSTAAAAREGPRYSTTVIFDRPRSSPVISHASPRLA
jgi:2,4-dienoyl-CoA reductase-like NADH-dependent reductase (Old Yellow Enzyme family)